MGLTDSHESPLEPGVYLLPAGCVDALPPESWPDEKWPRWSGVAFELVTKPAAAKVDDPAAKLAAFLAANPDVAALVAQQN